jgi:ribonuclease HI
MYFDGSMTKMGARGYMICLQFVASNNVAEYEALVNGLRITIELGVRHLKVRGDSQLVVD